MAIPSILYISIEVLLRSSCNGKTKINHSELFLFNNEEDMENGLSAFWTNLESAGHDVNVCCSRFENFGKKCVVGGASDIHDLLKPEKSSLGVSVEVSASKVYLTSSCVVDGVSYERTDMQYIYEDMDEGLVELEVLKDIMSPDEYDEYCSNVLC